MPIVKKRGSLANLFEIANFVSMNNQCEQMNYDKHNKHNEHFEVRAQGRDSSEKTKKNVKNDFTSLLPNDIRNDKRPSILLLKNPESKHPIKKLSFNLSKVLRRRRSTVSTAVSTSVSTDEDTLIFVDNVGFSSHERTESAETNASDEISTMTPIHIEKEENDNNCEVASNREKYSFEEKNPWSKESSRSILLRRELQDLKYQLEDGRSKHKERKQTLKKELSSLKSELRERIEKSKEYAVRLETAERERNDVRIELERMRIEMEQIMSMKACVRRR